MSNYFNLNFNLPFGMNNWFMPSFSFQNFYSPFQTAMFNFNSCIFNPFNYNYFNSQITQPSLFTLDFSDFYRNINPAVQKSTTTNVINNSGMATVAAAAQTSSSNVDTFTRTSNINYAKDKLSLDDYNAFKGERLANIALSNSKGWTGYCAKYVKKSIQEANLGPYLYGHAYQMTNILRHNPNFKEISTQNVDVKNLPAGCVLVYGKGVEGYSKNYGHTEITTGDGRAVSDGITQNLHKKPSAIFIPV